MHPQDFGIFLTTDELVAMAGAFQLPSFFCSYMEDTHSEITAEEAEAFWEKCRKGLVEKKYLLEDEEGNLLANPGFLYILGSCFAAEKAMAVQYTGKGETLWDRNLYITEEGIVWISRQKDGRLRIVPTSRKVIHTELHRLVEEIPNEKADLKIVLSAREYLGLTAAVNMKNQERVHEILEGQLSDKAAFENFWSAFGDKENQLTIVENNSLKRETQITLLFFSKKGAWSLVQQENSYIFQTVSHDQMIAALDKMTEPG